MIELITTHEGITYFPVVKSDIKWEVSRDGSAGKLTFSVFADGILKIEEGDEVRFRYNDTDVFFGFVFAKKSSKDDWIDITAYDQLRYFKNKYSYLYNNTTVTTALKELCEIFQLRIGTIDNTGFLIESLVEDSVSLLDIIMDGLDATIENTNQLYVLYDDFGKICLRNIADMKTTVLLDNTCAEDFAYESSIDKETYNRVILFYDPDEDSERRQYFKAEDMENVRKWGMLLLYESVKSPSIGQNKANAMLKLHNKKTKSLSFKGVIGNLAVKAGSLVVVNLKLDDYHKQSYMLVSKVSHTFNADSHFMDVTLEGGWEE